MDRASNDVDLNLDFDDLEPEEVTGVYDVAFFKKGDIPRPPRRALEHLEDARIGLGLFMEEAEQALSMGDMTVDQRIHVATIMSYVEGLAQRFDVIRQPGFKQKRR